MTLLHYHQGDLFELAPEGASLAHCVSADLAMGKGIAKEFKNRFGGFEKLRKQNPKPGKTLVLEVEETFVYYLVTKMMARDKPEGFYFYRALRDLRTLMEARQETQLWIPKIGCGLDELNWDDQVSGWLEKIFGGWEGEIHVCVLN